MMRLLERTASLNETFFTTEAGTRFRGSLQPVNEGSQPVDTFAEPRVIMRVRRNEPVKSGDIVMDAIGRRFLVADHDEHIWNDSLMFRSHKMLRITDRLSWRRSQDTTDVVTGLKRSGTEVELGPIWCVLEVYGREQIDFGLRVAEDLRRVITGADVKLGDRIDDAIVKRIAPIFGVKVLEIQ